MTCVNAGSGSQSSLVPFIIKRLLVMVALLPQANGSFAANAQERLANLDQANVYGNRSLSQLRRALVDAEDRFYEEYNEQNTNDDFDVNCGRVARTGSRLILRICRAVYQEEAIREGSKEGLETQQRFQDEGLHGRGAMPRSPPVPAAMRILALQPDFQHNMAKVVARSRVLTRLLLERAEAQAALDAAQRDADAPEGGNVDPADLPAVPDVEPGASLPPG